MIEINYWGLGLIIAMMVAAFFLGVGLGTWLEDRAIAKRQVETKEGSLTEQEAIQEGRRRGYTTAACVMLSALKKGAHKEDMVLDIGDYATYIPGKTEEQDT